MVPREVGATKNSFHASRYLRASTENSLFLSKNGEAKPSIYAQIKVCSDGVAWKFYRCVDQLLGRTR